MARTPAQCSPHHLAPDPSATPPRTQLLANIAALLFTETRETSLSFPGTSEVDQKRAEIRGQASLIARDSVQLLLVHWIIAYPVEGQGPRALSPENSNDRSNAAMSSLFKTGSSFPIASGQSYHDFLYIDFNPESSAQLIFARDFFPHLEAGFDTGRLYEQLIFTLREYSSLILQRDHWSPFIHHGSYRCPMGGMARPMGVALACVSAYTGSFGSNYGFVDTLINKERDKLVRNFQSFLGTPENSLAAVHAVCIYQTPGLFGGNFLPVAVKLSRQVEEGLEKQKEASENFAESLRRNIFFANVINILDARAGKLSSAYFEPLDDEAVLTLPLPAPESPTGQKARLTQTLKELLMAEEAGTLDVSTLLPLTRVILASMKIIPTRVVT
ncbi:predicted protein [Aspergillus nidulans FGSC A4]|uniref:C6 transcription factor, putative (AFU_orthologue AFUA_5G14230) n=1 Tax=Emericella nidulans (strain FGSC A4 / ATCC 38163 / CBS 112.46 / NRRL 194 / M139) TaxID=227321 RepID=Q5B9V7_EMENI|nr:hypothetical protein [Aspergillus nidulans FGSC A4]EAA63075.1 predicted protein [Aspergillus nidulans FGSC A4]CBF84234.1 TPA: C6 transcription factor, putative (AFU_orthologue; AFUA_5G14230) [Aspergillus nidulans FGSC A4]|eukprot:XP_660277.1 predicted protein [Aspergillus nidulans FGSC A4]